MEKKKILVVDDERDLCDILLFNLRTAGYVAAAAYSTEEAMQVLAEEAAATGAQFDLLLLDVMLPGASGFEFAQQLRTDAAMRHLPIIFLTAKDSEDDMLHGFSIGADDYVTKPFSIREVLARVKAVLARGSAAATPDRTIAFQGLVLEQGSKKATIDGQPVALTRTEYDLLKLFLEHHGQIFNRQQLLQRVWPQEVIVTERTVDVNIARLRKKLGQYGARLVSRVGFGYLFQK